MSIITIPSNHDFELFYLGQKLADHKKRRAVSMLLAVIAGLLLYTGTKPEPMDEQLTYAGILTLVYVFFGRTFLFKIKIKTLWKQKKETNQEIAIDGKGVNINHQRKELVRTLIWEELGFYRIEEGVIFLFPRKQPENFLVLSLKDINQDNRSALKSIIKEQIKTDQQN